MDHNLISAVAALAGAAIVAVVSFLRSWLVHQGEVRAQWLAQEGLRRQDLYKEFIEDASKCYLHALQHHEPDISLLVVLYAKMSRMRVLASPKVLATAEDALRRIIETYSETDVTITDTNLRILVQKGSFDLLHDFSQACREESVLRASSFERPRGKSKSARFWRSLHHRCARLSSNGRQAGADPKRAAGRELGADGQAGAARRPTGF
jgi:hypothetical protein